MANIQNIPIDEKLRVSNPKINQNFQNLNNEITTNANNLEAHKTSKTAHAAQNITYSGKAVGNNVKDAIDNTNDRISEIVAQAGGDNTEIVDARGGYPVLGDRLNDMANDIDSRVKKDNLFVNIKDYGAKGDGVTDDTQAIQDAINDVISNGKGGRIFFPTGTYLLKSLQDLSLEPFAIRDPNLYIHDISNLQLVGTGATHLKASPPGNLSYVLLINNCKNIEISGINFVGDNMGLPPEENNAGLGLENIVGLRVANCTFSGFQGSYVVGDWIFNALIENCDFDVKSGTAFDHAFLQDYTVRNCRLRGNGKGENGFGTQGFQVHYDVPQANFNLTGEALTGGITNNVTLDNNSFSGFKTAVYFSDMVDSRIINNNLYNNFVKSEVNVWAIVLGNSQPSIAMSGIKIDRNIISGNGSDSANPHSGGGITITAGDSPGVHVDITNNDIFDNKTDGILVTSNNVTLRAKDNRLYNRNGNNQTVLFSGFSGLTTNSLVVDNEGFNPRSLNVLTPALPGGVGSNYSVTNSNPFPVMIYQRGGSGLHIVTPLGLDVAISGGDQSIIKLLPFHKIYFSTVNTTAWTWVGE